MSLKYSNAYIAKYGIKMVSSDGKSEIKVYSVDELENHSKAGWLLESKDVPIKLWNIVRNLMRDIEVLQKQVEDLGDSGGFVKREELKSYVFKDQ